MQILIGLGDVGQVVHTEELSVLQPLQLIALAHARLPEFARVEVWQDCVCVLQCPPEREPRSWRELGESVIGLPTRRAS
jgi:hypothetical protein